MALYEKFALGVCVFFTMIGAYGVKEVTRPLMVTVSIELPVRRTVVALYELPMADITNTYEYIVASEERQREMLAVLVDVETVLEMPRIVHTRIYSAAEYECLAKNIYFESRSDPVRGQMGVALVTLNRANNPRFPGDLCDVSRDGGEIVRHRCQFSWYCDGLSDRPRDEEAYERAEMLADAVLYPNAVLLDMTNGATHYYSPKAMIPVGSIPYWVPFMVRTVRIETHIYFREDQILHASL